MILLGRNRGETIEGIEVRGDANFRARTREALGLLKQTPAISLVRTHVKVIRQGKRSGMRAWDHEPTFVAGRATWQHSPLWYAGAIAHDAYHAKLYDLAMRIDGGGEPAADAWTGVDAEKKCLAFQYEVLQTLDSDATTLRYVARCAENPSYQGRNHGFGSWLDYLWRWW
jgi:hypothetical protein